MLFVGLTEVKKQSPAFFKLIPVTAFSDKIAVGQLTPDLETNTTIHSNQNSCVFCECRQDPLGGLYSPPILDDTFLLKRGEKASNQKISYRLINNL